MKSSKRQRWVNTGMWMRGSVSSKPHSPLMTEFPGCGHWAGEAGQGFVPERWPCGGVFSGHRQTRSDQKRICLQEIRSEQSFPVSYVVFFLKPQTNPCMNYWHRWKAIKEQKMTVAYSHDVGWNPRKESETWFGKTLFNQKSPIILKIIGFKCSY